MEREAGAGIRMGNTCKSMADSCQCMAKTTTKKVIKVISLQLIKIIGKIIVIIKMRKLKPREVKGISLEHNMSLLLPFLDLLLGTELLSRGISRPTSLG